MPRAYIEMILSSKSGKRRWYLATCPLVSGLTLARRGSKEQALQRRVTIHSCGGVAEWPKAAVC